MIFLNFIHFSKCVLNQPNPHYLYHYNVCYSYYPYSYYPNGYQPIPTNCDSTNYNPTNCDSTNNSPTSYNPTSYNQYSFNQQIYNLNPSFFTHPHNCLKFNLDNINTHSHNYTFSYEVSDRMSSYLLNLQNNNLTDFPTENSNIFTFYNHNNKIFHCIPHEKFCKLKYLNLSFNNFYDFPFNQIDDLFHLIINNNKFTNDKINQLIIKSNLKTMVINNNQLTYLNMKHHPNLERLNANDNRISKAYFHDLPELIYLNLSNNRISELNFHENFYDLPKLAYLNLRNNELNYVSSSIKKLKGSLKKLDLRGNPLIESSENENYLGLKELIEIFGDKVLKYDK